MIISVQVDYHFACRLARFLLRCLKIAVSMTLTRDTSSFTCDGSGLGPARSQGMTGHDKGPDNQPPRSLWSCWHLGGSKAFEPSADAHHIRGGRLASYGGLQGDQSRRSSGSPICLQIRTADGLALMIRAPACCLPDRAYRRLVATPSASVHRRSLNGHIV